MNLNRGLALILAFCSSLSFGASFHFLSRPFQKLDPTELETLRASETSEGISRALIDFHLFEAYQLRGAIHKASAALSRAESFCKHHLKDLSGESRGRGHLLCALVESEAGPPASPVQHYFSLQRLKAHITGYARAPLSGNEKLYSEARLYLALPAEAGRDIKKALVSLQFLLRQAPDAVVAQHFIGRAHQMSGNQSAAIENYNIAFHQKLEDGRTVFFYDGKNLAHQRERADGVTFGFRPGLIVGPALGFGLSLSLWDERIADTRRGFDITGSAATRGVFEIGGRYNDAETLSPFVVSLSARGRWRNEDFFGFGAATLLSANSPISTQSWDASLRFGYPVFQDALLYLGWEFGTTRVTTGSVAPALAGGFRSEPHIGFEWDSRDSAFDPWHGFRVAWQYGYARRSLGSDFDFERGLLSGDAVFSLGARKAIWLKSDLEYVTGQIPYGWIPKWGGVRSAPATRRSRYQDNVVWQSTLEPRFGIGGYLVVGAFANFGTASPRFGDLFRTTWQAGGGALFEINTAKYRSQRLRGEIGYFGNEWLIQVFASATL